MIYLQEGNFPLNEAFSSEIVQEANSTYQLTFKFPTSDSKWALLTPETELVADDLHGEQYFTIFEVEKQHGYVTVYANQVATLLNGYSINKINVDRVNGVTVMNALVAGFKRETPFTFFSDVMSKHTLNLKDISAMEALAKDKHSIVGQWGGDLVRDKYSVRLLENGGIENESLFAYKKNMKSFQESKSTKELRTRIHFKKVIEAHEEGKKDQILTVTIDSPLINKYKHIYEADMEVQDQDVVDQKTLEEYGKRYFRETLCDMIEESLEIDVVGQADQPVHMFDIVSIFHEGYDVDLRKKITKYKFNPMSIKLVSIGFGEVARTLADSISGMVNDSVDKKMKSYDAEYEAKVQKLVDNANAEYDKQAKELEHKITDGIEQAKAQAEVVKQEINGIVAQKILESKQLTDSEIAKANAKAEEALSKAGTFPDTNQLSYQIKQQILNSPDFGTKVTQTFEQTENGETIYSKIAGKIEKKFITIDATDARFRQASEQVDRKVSAAIGTVDGKISTIDGKISQANADINNANSRIDKTNQNLASTNATVAEHTRQIEVQVQNYNAVRESTKLYERIIGTSETDAPDKLSRLVMSSEIFQTEVGKYAKEDFNLVYDPTNFSKWAKKSQDANITEVGADTKLLRITTVDKQSSVYHGFALPLTESTFTEGEKLSYRMELWVDVLPDRPMGLELWGADGGITSDRIYLDKTGRQIVTGTMTVKRSSNKAKEFPFEIWLMRNGTVAVGKVSLIRGDTPPKYFFDKTSPQEIATKTQVKQLAGSYAIQNLNSAGDIISGVNLGADGTNRFVGKLTHITGETQIDNAVIKSAMVDKLKTGNFEAGSVTTQILASNAVTADKLLVDAAMINKLVSNQAFIKELTSQKAFITQLTSINISAEHVKGGRLSANTGSTVFDLDNGTLNLYSNTGTIRRIDDTSSSQFIKLTKSGFIAEQFRDSNAALMVIGTNHNKNPKEVERHDNETFAGIRLWSGKGNGKEESLTEFVGDRVLIYNNGPNRSPWNFHNNMQGKETYLLPMNENRVKHYIGRGDFFLEGVYSKKFFLAGGVDVGAYLWDLLTCFGMMVRHGMITNTTIKNHIQGILNGHGFR
nr:MAG TPA: Neck appendage protein [Caudoviricetes sp.]